MLGAIKVKIEKILFPKRSYTEWGDYIIVSCSIVENNDNIKIKLNSKYKNFIIKGKNLPPIKNNSIYSFNIENEIEDEKNGFYYTIQSVNLSNELNDNINKKIFLLNILNNNHVDSLYETLQDPFEALKNNNIEELIKAKNIGKITAEKLIHQFNENYKYANLLIKYGDLNMTINFIQKLERKYLSIEKIIEVLDENIYTLANEINGIGFITVDKYALKMGMHENSINRLKAYMIYYLREQSLIGNSWVRPSQLIEAILKMFANTFNDELIKESLYSLYNENYITWNTDKTYIALKEIKDLEKEIYNEILRLHSAENRYIRNEEIENQIILENEENQGWNYTDEQKYAASGILNNNVSVLTAVAGGGKTSLIKLVVKTMKKAKYMYSLACLAGKAAQRLQEATDCQASTIHRLLNWRQGVFGFNKNNPLITDLVCLDEVSMLGADLFLHVLKAIPTGAKLVLVGDIGQLEAIGLGNVLKDIIESNKIPVYKLTQIHRQASKSAIITESLKVRAGKYICPKSFTGIKVLGELQDLTIDIYQNSILSRPKVIDWYKKIVHNLDEAKETSIVVAMKERGDLGSYSLNNEIQDFLNPKDNNKKEVKIKKNNVEYFLRLNDKIINRKNMYTVNKYDWENQCIFISSLNNESILTEIFNGYEGYIRKIENDKIVVDFFDCGYVEIDKRNFSNLELGYAITTHSKQGSQCQNIICAFDYSAFHMLCRQMLYTAMTRAQKNCILLAESRALEYAISVSRVSQKQTFLKYFLTKEEIS